jgi:hypothetical protein
MAITPIVMPTVPQADLGGAYKKGLDLRILGMQPDVIEQQLSSARTAEEAQRAQMPGLHAQSQSLQLDAKVKETAAADNAKLSEIVPKHRGPDGTVNFGAAAAEAQAAGVSITGLNLLRGNELKHHADNIKNKDDAVAYARKTAFYTADAILAKLRNGVITPAEAAEQTNQANSNAAQFAGEHAPDVLAAIKPATPENVEGLLHSTTEAYMGPVVRAEEERKARKHEIEMKEIDKLTDLKDPVLIAAQDAFAKRHPEIEGIKRSLTGPAMQSWPGEKELREAEIEDSRRSVEARDTAETGQKKLESDRDVLGEALSVTKGKTDWLKLNPEERATVETAVAVLNERNKTTLDPQAWFSGRNRAVMDAERRRLTAEIDSLRGRAASSRVPKSGAPSGEASAKAGTRSNPTVIKTEAEYDALPSGAIYLAPGKTKPKVKP